MFSRKQKKLLILVHFLQLLKVMADKKLHWKNICGFYFRVSRIRSGGGEGREEDPAIRTILSVTSGFMQSGT